MPTVLACASYMRSKLVALAMPPAGLTARLPPFTVDGLTCVASKVVLEASRRGQWLATWSVGARIVATAGANPLPGRLKILVYDDLVPQERAGAGSNRVEGMSTVKNTAERREGRGRTLTDSKPVDGRAARSHRSRQAIIDAMRALHAEGDLRPTAPRVAERAGVSLRTVWQQFTDMETLLVEANRRDNEILRSLMKQIDPDQPLAARIALFIGQRAAILEQMTPSWRAARLQAPFSEELRRSKARTLAMAKAELETVFAPELLELAGKKRQELCEGLHAISIWSSWESLRTELDLSAEQAESLIRATVTALLAEAGFR
jgi:TetR/AcrR family transcriptional regulator of autoinduction and epiphytic fitness